MEVNIKALKARIETIRGQISTTSELAAGYADPFPTASIIKARVESEAAAIQAAAHDRITLGYAGAAESNWRPGIIGQSLAKLSAVELMVLVEPSKLAKVLIEMGEQEASAVDPAYRLTTTEAAAALAAKPSKVLAFEIAEEQLVREAEEAGFTIQRRRDALPQVVLAPDAELHAFLSKAKAA